MAAAAKRCNLLLWGVNAFAVDMTVVKLMGFDFTKIDTLNVAKNAHDLPIFSGDESDISILSTASSTRTRLSELQKLVDFAFEPSKGWKGHIELEEGSR